MKNKKIVFIDKDDFYRKLYKRKLEEEGVELFVAKTGNEGWDIIQREDPDLVITEVMVQGKGGFKIKKEMNKDDDLSNIPFVVLTDLAQESDKEQAKEMGVDAYFVKQESEVSEVLDKIKSLLNN